MCCLDDASTILQDHRVPLPNQFYTDTDERWQTPNQEKCIAGVPGFAMYRTFCMLTNNSLQAGAPSTFGGSKYGWYALVGLLCRICIVVGSRPSAKACIEMLRSNCTSSNDRARHNVHDTCNAFRNQGRNDALVF